MTNAKSRTFDNRVEYRKQSEIQSGIEVIDNSFKDYLGSSVKANLLWSGTEWSEGPAYIPNYNAVIWSDVPNDRMLKYDLETGLTTTFREPSNYSNGNTIDLEGRLITCEHLTNRVTRTEPDNSITILTDNYLGKRLNSPNDVVVKSDGSIWFTDPPYGITTDREGTKRKSDLEGNFIYRIDPIDKKLEIVFDGCDKPNGLAFSVDENTLYVSDTGEPQNIIAIDVGSNGKTLNNSKQFVQVRPGIADGFRLDVLGNIWTSAWDGVHCYSPSGNLIGKILIPEQRTANLVFGGQDYKCLYIAADTSLYSIQLNIEGAIKLRSLKQ